jgi:hypothetical protein
MEKSKPEHARYLAWAIVLLAVWQVSTWGMWGVGPYGAIDRSPFEPQPGIRGSVLLVYIIHSIGRVASIGALILIIMGLFCFMHDRLRKA